MSDFNRLQNKILDALEKENELRSGASPFIEYSQADLCLNRASVLHLLLLESYSIRPPKVKASEKKPKAFI